jgi:anti-sigma B factor antagonist
MIQFSHHVIDHGIVIVDLGGRLDESSCQYFFDCMQGIIEDGHHRIVVDASDLGYVSSIGLGMLIRGQSRIRTRGGELHLASLQGAVFDVLRVTHLDRLFDIHATVEDALIAMQGSTETQS